MPETLKFKPGAERIKIDLKSPKTVKQWCGLYRKLADEKDVYASMTGNDAYASTNWGNEEKSRELLTYDQFQRRAKACQIYLADSKLIDNANKKIQALSDK